MINKVNLFFIYAPKCKHCKQMEASMESAVKKSKIPCNIKKFLYTNKVAINIAVNNNIKDLPALVIGQGKQGNSFCGDDYDEKRIIEAIKKVASSCPKKKAQKRQKK